MKLGFIHILLKHYQPLRKDQFLRLYVKTSIRVCKCAFLILTSRFVTITKPSFWGITLKNNYCTHEVLFKIGAVLGKNFQTRTSLFTKSTKFTTRGTTFVKISQAVEAGQSLKGIGMETSLLPSDTVQPQPRPV